MPSETSTKTVVGAMDGLRGVHDAITVKRVFGDPYVADGVIVVPVARVGGGGGGGAGEAPEEDGGGGYGSGFGIGAYPVGIYEIRDGVARWKPAVDVNRLLRGGQVLAGIMSICATLVLLRRS